MMSISWNGWKDERSSAIYIFRSTNKWNSQWSDALILRFHHFHSLFCFHLLSPFSNLKSFYKTRWLNERGGREMILRVMNLTLDGLSLSHSISTTTKLGVSSLQLALVNYVCHQMIEDTDRNGRLALIFSHHLSPLTHSISLFNHKDRKGRICFY